MTKPNIYRMSPGFTLVELLVVVLIIATLAALSIFGLSRMRSAGDLAATVSVLRQLQIANISYAADHNGRYVPMSSNDENQKRTDWPSNPVFLSYFTGDSDRMSPGAKSSSTNPIPNSLLDPVVVRARKNRWNFLDANYGYNLGGMPELTGPNSDRNFAILQLTNPVRTAAFITATDWNFRYSGRLLWENNPSEGRSSDGKIAYRHRGKAAVVYYDGSTGIISPGDMKRIDSTGATYHPFWRANFK